MISVEAGYAEALQRVALQGGVLRRVADELYALARVVESRQGFFFNPQICSARHIAAFAALASELDALTLRFVTLLASRRLLKALPAIQQHFDGLALRALGDEKIILRIPYAPSEGLVSELLVFLAETGLLSADKHSEAKVNVVIDKQLIGGFCAEYGGHVFDASLKRRLDSLRSRQNS